MRTRCFLGLLLLWNAGCARISSTGFLVTNRVWVVASSDPQELQATIDAAAPGDEVRIGNLSLSYVLNRPIGKGITIRGPGFVLPVLGDLDAPASEPIRFVDIEFGFFQATIAQTVSHLEVLGGRVSFDSCRLHRLRVRAGEVLLNATAVYGKGLIVDAAQVAAVDSSFLGGVDYGQGGVVSATNPGIHLNPGARLQVSQCRLSAASGWLGLPPPPGLLVEPGALAWLVDSTFEGDTSAPASIDAPGIVNNSTTSLRAARCNVLAGGAGVSPVVGPVDLSAPLLGISITPTRLATGTTVAVRVTGQPGDAVLLRAGAELAVQDVPGVEQSQWLAGPTTVVAQGAIGAAGDAVFSVPLPIESVRLWLQASGGAVTAPQFSAPAGGLVR